MKKSTFWLLAALIFAALTIYTGYANHFDIFFTFTFTKENLSVKGSFSFIFAVLTVISLFNWLLDLLTK
ncbi:hypothetical protein OZX65_06355 [Leuconostocaceae bacterium ESL0723]|nr:hypothetical protein OZX65_06355 [Leuconostocaceae bacterium ESL0723]